MNPFRLAGTSPSGTVAAVWCCGQCNHVCHDEDHARRCCTCSYCKQPVEADKYGNRQTFHRQCQREAWAKNDAERMDKAKLVTDYDGPFLLGGDHYCKSMDEVIERLECDYESEEDWPEFIYACKESKPCISLSLGDLQHKIEDLWDDADWDCFKGVTELEAAFTAFNAANADMACYRDDHKRKVRIPRQTKGV